MNYQDDLQQHGINANHIDTLSRVFQQRAAALGGAVHPQAVYHSAATDIAMGALDLHREIEAEMEKDHSVKEWIEILTGAPLE